MATIKEIPAELRPYEKVLKYGPKNLDDSELLAVILRTGTKGMSSVDLSRNIISAGGGRLSGIRNLNYQKLLRIQGVGRVKAIQILCLCTLIVRFSAAYYSESEAYESPEWIAHRYMEEMRAEPREQVRVLYLDGRNRLKAEENLTSGSSDAAMFPIREILSLAFSHNAPGILVLHNHPSGDPEPSGEDIGATLQLQQAARLVGIRLLDHLIIGDRKYTSFRDLGILT